MEKPRSVGKTIYYKVLRKKKNEDGVDQLYSAIAGFAGFCSLRPYVYKEGEITKRKKGCGPMAVFRDFESAMMCCGIERASLGDGEDFGIYAVWIRECKKIKLTSRVTADPSSGLLANNCLYQGREIIGFDPPSKTVLANEVFIIKEVMDGGY